MSAVEVRLRAPRPRAAAPATAAPAPEQAGGLRPAPGAAAQPAAARTWPRRMAPWARLGAGVGFGAVALVVPWLASPVHRSATAWDVPVRLPGVPGAARVSYGAVVVVVLAVAVASAARHRAALTGCTRLAGWALLGTAVAFVVVARTSDGQLLFRLRADAAEYSSVTRQFGYTNSSYLPPTDVLGHRVDSTTLLLYDDLRVGWVSLVAAGAVLAGPVRWRGGRGGERFLIACAVLAAGAIAFGVARGLAAQARKLEGIAAERAGAPAEAIARLEAATRLDPSLTYDPDLVVTLGQAELDLGDRTTLPALYAAALSAPGASADEELAVLGAPAGKGGEGAVARSGVANLIARDAAAAGVLAGSAALARSDLAVAYTLGRYEYDHGDDPAVVELMRMASAQTDADDVRSSCLTYISLAELREGDDAGFRRDLIAAVRADPLASNTFAREISAGLYVPGTP